MRGKKITKEKRAKFLESLLATNGNVSKSCQAIGVSRNAIYDHKKADLKFSEMWEDVIETCIENAEQEMYRRSVEGIDKPIFYQGDLVDTVKEFSDRLLEFYLKAKRPEVYRERMDINAEISGTLSHDVQAAIKEVYGEKKDDPDGDGETDLGEEDDAII